MRLDEHQRKALHWALHATSGAAERWGNGRRLDDDSLRRRISQEFGIRGGFGMTGIRVEYWGGTNPGIEILIGSQPPVSLVGRDLLCAVRDLLRISHPDELF